MFFVAYLLFQYPHVRLLKAWGSSWILLSMVLGLLQPLDGAYRERRGPVGSLRPGDRTWQPSCSLEECEEIGVQQFHMRERQPVWCSGIDLEP